MPIREILLLVDCNIGLPNGASFCLNLAAKFGASITGQGTIVQHPIPEYLGTFPDMAALPEAAVDEHAKKLEEMRNRANRTQEYLDELAKMQDIQFHWELLEDAPQQLAERAGTRARSYDLVVIDQPNDASEDAWSDIIEKVILRSGRPVIVVPPHLEDVRIGSRTVIGWNDSCEAARAAHDAIPVLKLAEEARVVTIDDDGDEALLRHAVSLSEHLGEHGVEANSQKIASQGESVEDALLKHLVDVEANLLVVGGYGKSRWREKVFGSTTCHFVSKSPVPVLVSH